MTLDQNMISAYLLRTKIEFMAIDSLYFDYKKNSACSLSPFPIFHNA